MKKIFDDLKNFEKEYNEAIEKFLGRDNETRIIFLDADYGWGKTEFIKNVINVDESNIYSPWMDNSDNYLEEIYYRTNKIKKSKRVIEVIKIGAYISILTFLLSKLAEIFLNYFFNNNCNMWFGLICQIDMMNISKLAYLLFIISLIAISLYKIFENIEINFFEYFKMKNNDYDKYLEEKIIEKILNNLKTKYVLVIEDIDRIDDIEKILIICKKISDLMIKKTNDGNSFSKMYILITGEYSRFTTRITNKDEYEVNINGESNILKKGSYVAERLIASKINFVNKEQRIENLLLEYKIEHFFSGIEKEEVLFFIKTKQISFRFIKRFLEENLENLKEKNLSIFFLLVKYYFNNKVLNLEENAYQKSIYNINDFPNCLNDWELLFQKDVLNIDGKIYTADSFDITNSEKNINIINTSLYKLLIIKDKESKDIFKIMYNYNKVPLFIDEASIFQGDETDESRTVSVGTHMGNIYPNFKYEFDNYLISNKISANSPMISPSQWLPYKRCNFDYFSSNYYQNYFVNSINGDRNKYMIINSEEEFIIGYMAAFINKNQVEFNEKYPYIMSVVNSITQ